MKKYAEGRRAWGHCERCGLRYLLSELSSDGHQPDLLVCVDCWDPEHPQERLPDLTDAVTLRDPTGDLDKSAIVAADAPDLASPMLAAWSPSSLDDEGSSEVLASGGTTPLAYSFAWVGAHDGLTFVASGNQVTVSGDAGSTGTIRATVTDANGATTTTDLGVAIPVVLTWTAQTSPFPSTQPVYDVIYAQSRFTAVGTDNFETSIIAHSPDGETWTPIADTSFGATSIRGIAYNGVDTLVAVGASGKVATSPDGETWTQRTGGHGTSTIEQVMFLDGQFFSVGASGKMARSSDGITWTAITSPFSTSTVWDIGYGDGVYVATGSSGKLARSLDGSSWALVTSPFGTSIVPGVYHASGLFVAVGQSGKIATSPDGETWALLSSEDASFGTSVIFAVFHASGVWLAGANDGKIAESSDGLVWTQVTPTGMTSNVLAFARGSGFFVAVGAQTGISKSSVYP